VDFHLHSFQDRLLKNPAIKMNFINPNPSATEVADIINALEKRRESYRNPF
jgi:hypothetical protein